MRGERPRAQRRKLNIKWPTKFKLFFWKSALFVKSSSHFSMRWEKPRVQLGKFHINWSTKRICLLWKPAIDAQVVPHFSMRWERPRAHSAENVSIYNLFSYGFLNKTARAARKCFRYITHFSYGLNKRARGVVESVCRWNAKPRPPEKWWRQSEKFV